MEETDPYNLPCSYLRLAAVDGELTAFALETFGRPARSEEVLPQRSGDRLLSFLLSVGKYLLHGFSKAAEAYEPIGSNPASAINRPSEEAGFGN
ncbi:hypothetical protein [Oryzifoliimicrobium ureilyticus]|uniref:hypothetical protein n=1 Tax=Oryzifoliimicrobium ureilyticus TaxID=3113724 RepID=UPI0030764EE9